jgi:hypothetical protein
MGAITNLDTLVANASDSTKSQNIPFTKTGRVAGAAVATPLAGSIHSLWMWEGFPSHAATPTTLIYPTNVNQGGLKQADPGGGRQNWLMSFSHLFQDAGTLVLVDRLAQQGGLSSSSTTNQSVSSTITRYTSGKGNWLWLEITTQPGSPTSTTFHFDYTDENSQSVTTYEHQIGASNYNTPQQVFIPGLVPSSGVGGTGVKNMTNFKLAATSGTGGDYVAVIGHPLCVASANLAGMMGIANWIQGCLPVEILTDACLQLILLTNSNVPGYVEGMASMVEA